MFKRIKRSFIEISLALFVVGIIWIISSFSMGLFSPVTVNKYVLTNGHKTVVFQEMRHIGLGEFYKKVDNDVYYYRKQQYVFGYEGIFDIGNKASYQNEKIDYSQKYIEQPIMLGGLHADDVNLDLNWFDIVSKLENRMTVENQLNMESMMYKTSMVSDLPFFKYQNEMNVNNVNPVEYASDNVYRIRYFENLKNEYGIDIAKLYYWSNPVEQSVIMDERNQLVADFILNTSHDKILIHYGADHFDGIFSMLKNSDSKWKIVRVEKIDVL